MQQIFYHNFSGEINTQNIQFPEIMSKAITLHPVKQTGSIFELYVKWLRFKHLQLRSSLPPTIRKIDDRTETWDLIQGFHYSASNMNPKRGLNRHLVASMRQNYIELVRDVNVKLSKTRKSVQFKGLNYGYLRMNQFVGVDYVLDLFLTYRSHKGKKLSSTVRKHISATQTFSTLRIRRINPSTDSQTVVNIVLPLSGRLSTFRKFLSNFRSLYSSDKYISLAVIMFSESSETQETKSLLVDMMRQKYPVRLAQLSGTFSRAAALQR